MDPDRTPSRNVTLSAVRRRPRKHGMTFTVAWTVDGRPHHRSFRQRTPADALYRDLQAARLEGERFDPETGLPLSVLQRTRPDLVILDRAAHDRLVAAADRGKPAPAAHSGPQPGSWEELFAQVPHAREAAKRREDILDTRRRCEVPLDDASQVGFIATWEQECHLVLDVSELDERAPGWRRAIDRPGNYNAADHLDLRMLLGEHLGDADTLAEMVWFKLAPIAGSTEAAPPPDRQQEPETVYVEVSRRITHQVALPADLLDHEAPRWRQALANDHFRDDGIDDPDLVEAIGGLVDARIDLAEPDTSDGFEIRSMSVQPSPE